MKQGTQIAYIPNHAKGDITHPDVEFGFVTAEAPIGFVVNGQSKYHFCRYWSKGKLGTELRTLSCSQMTPTKCLVEHDSVPQGVVDSWLARRRKERLIK